MKYEIRQSLPFEKWFAGLKDAIAKRQILARLARIENGNLGDYKAFDNIIELRIFHGPGYRLYGTIRDGRILLLLVGGDKASQKSDIDKARKILGEIQNEDETI